MEAATALAADDPIMVAWNEYAATDDYKNSFKWAEHEQYRAGSMWAAFLAGWQASHPASAPTPAAPRVGDDVKDKIMDILTDDGLLVDRADQIIALFSAPPAASADEREDRVQVADEMRSYFYEDAAECSPHKYAEFLQCADIALGYRKLAPAQSVGQSAAQGVALDEHEPTCAMVKPRLMLPMPACTCRLSKGQDDEG